MKKRENGIKYWVFAAFFENIGINEVKKQMIIPTYFNQFEISIFISLKSKYKKNYQIYDSQDIEEENKRLFKALLYSYNIDAEQFEGTIEIYEYE